MTRSRLLLLISSLCLLAAVDEERDAFAFALERYPHVAVVLEL